jgi:hypothetical protein
MREILVRRSSPSGEPGHRFSFGIQEQQKSLEIQNKEPNQRREKTERQEKPELNFHLKALWNRHGSGTTPH